MKRRRVVALFAAAVLLLPPVPSAVAVAACGRQASELIPATGAYFGAHAHEGSANGVSEPAALELKLGRQLAINHNFQLTPAVHTASIQADIAAGRIPMISWAAGDEVELASMANGGRDDEIEAQAEALAAFCVPMFLRFSWEFDLRYSNPATFVTAWERVRATFRTIAPNVAFVWNPTWRAYSETNKADGFYPTDNDDVDWIAADGYSRPKPDKPEYNYRSFHSMFEAAHTFAEEHQKPFMVGETGIHRADMDPIQASWLDATRADIKTMYPALKAFVYFHRDGNDLDNHWRVDVPVNGEAQQALRAYVLDPFFNPS